MKAITTAKSTPARRGRPRKVESYADWMSRVDAEVDHMARSMERKPPTYANLHPAQRKIVQMLIEHMRSLPGTTPGEDAYLKREYSPINHILTRLFRAKYPEWARAPKTTNGYWDPTHLPAGEGEVLVWMLRNCAGRSPAKVAAQDTDDDD